jgi:hypothetical protein
MGKKYVKCPRCELNYILEDEDYCHVCKSEMKHHTEADDELLDLEDMELCPVCGQNYIKEDQYMCDECKKKRNGDGSSLDDFEDDSKDSSSGGINLPDENKVENKAKSTPVGVFNPTKRFYRMHLHAEKVVKEKLGKLLNKSKMGDGNSVVIENSAIEDGDFNMDADEILITVKVQIDKAKVQGFRKFIAVLKED